MIYVFTDNGKGKTSAAVGTGIRAVGAGKKVLMIQFLKNGSSSENKILKKINNFEIKTFGRKGFFLPQSKLEKHPELKEEGIKSFSEKDIELAKQGLKEAKKAAQSKKYDLLILDEINLVLNFGLIEKKEFLAFLKKHQDKLDIILTGRYAPKEIIKISDLVTDFKEVKHYYRKGIGPKKGIDL